MLLSMLFPNRYKSSFTFGEQGLTDRMKYEQMCISIFLIFPLSVLFGQLMLRLVTKRFLLKSIRSDVWTTILRVFVADMLVMEWLVMKSFSCIPFEGEDETYKELILQSFGVGCPLYARPLSLQSAASLYGYRILAILIGIWIGERGMRAVALTGNIATGKSTVAKQLVHGCIGNLVEEKKDGTQGNSTKVEKLQENDNYQQKKTDNSDDNDNNDVHTISDGTVFLVDADKIGHDIFLKTTQGNVYDKVVETFGTDILNDKNSCVIDRTKLGSKIFGDQNLRRKLNRITHPTILFKLLKTTFWGLFISQFDIIVADIPLLFEAKTLPYFFCLIVVVSCTEEQQLARLQKRNPELSLKECKARIATQMPLEKKVRRADIVINNTTDYSTLVDNVEIVREEIMWRLYGIGLTLFQIMTIIALSMPLAVYIKFTYEITESE